MPYRNGKFYQNDCENSNFLTSVFQIIIHPAHRIEAIAIFFRGNADMFFKLLDKIALRTKAEKAADFEGGIVGKLDHLCSGFDFFSGDIFADGGAEILCKEAGEIRNTFGECSGDILDINAFMEVIADIIEHLERGAGILSAALDLAHPLCEFNGHIEMEGMDFVGGAAGIGLLNKDIAQTVRVFGLHPAVDAEASNHGDADDKMVLKVLERIGTKLSEAFTAQRCKECFYGFEVAGAYTFIECDFTFEGSMMKSQLTVCEEMVCERFSGVNMINLAGFLLEWGISHIRPSFLNIGWGTDILFLIIQEIKRMCQWETAEISSEIRWQMIKNKSGRSYVKILKNSKFLFFCKIPIG